jgi:hypothetical protein
LPSAAVVPPQELLSERMKAGFWASTDQPGILLAYSKLSVVEPSSKPGLATVGFTLVVVRVVKVPDVSVRLPVKVRVVFVVIVVVVNVLEVRVPLVMLPVVSVDVNDVWLEVMPVVVRVVAVLDVTVRVVSVLLVPVRLPVKVRVDLVVIDEVVIDDTEVRVVSVVTVTELLVAVVVMPVVV